jgi:hypothetical protein
LQVLQLCEELDRAVAELLSTAPETTYLAQPAPAAEGDALQSWLMGAANAADLRLLRSRALRLRLAVAGPMAPEKLSDVAAEVLAQVQPRSSI